MISHTIFINIAQKVREKAISRIFFSISFEIIISPPARGIQASRLPVYKRMQTGQGVRGNRYNVDTLVPLLFIEFNQCFFETLSAI